MEKKHGTTGCLPPLAFQLLQINMSYSLLFKMQNLQLLQEILITITGWKEKINTNN